MTFKNIFIASALLLSSAAFAQDKPLSPPQTAEGMIGDTKITIEYNAPSVRDRAVWGDLVPYDKVWRTGANEATRFTTDKNIMIEGDNALEAGTYALFTIPGEETWTIIFNKDPKQWGAYKYNADMDVLRVEVKPTTGKHQEQMMFEVGKDKVNLKWEKVAVSFNVQPMP